MVLAGDWRQILPVMPRGSRADIVNATIKKSRLYSLTGGCRYTMVTNQRAARAGGDTQAHAEFLLKLGGGEVPTHADRVMYGDFKIQIPQRYLLRGNTLKDLIDFTFEGMLDQDENGVPNYARPGWFASRAIICPRNRDVDEINSLMVNRIPGAKETFLSCNQLLEDDEGHNYAPEDIASLSPPGWPPHRLELKINAPVMLLRNLDPSCGHVNGARYIVRKMGRYILQFAVMGST